MEESFFLSDKILLEEKNNFQYTKSVLREQRHKEKVQLSIESNKVE